MNDKKHIDRLFQEKFKDFEMKPNANVWANIESQLEKPKRKRRVIPIWLRYGGIAATLLLFLVIGNSIFNNNSEANKIVDTKTEEKLRSNESNNEDKNGNIREKEEIESGVENNTAISNTNNTDSKSIESNQISNKEESKALQNKTKKENNLNNSNYRQSNSVIAGTNSNSEKTSNMLKDDASKNVNYDNVNATNIPSEKNKTVSNSTLYAQNTKANNDRNKTTSNSTIANSNTAPNTNKTNTKTPSVLDNNITPSYTGVAVTDSEKEKLEEEKKIEKDSANSSETIEEAIAKNQDFNEKEEENVTDRWIVNANVAPVYYNTLGKGSHIHDQFIDNPKAGKINTSYGVKVGYALNKKLKVRSGVSMLDLSYDTANVMVYDNVSSTTPNTSALRNIDFTPNANGQTFAVLSRDNLAAQQASRLVGDNSNAVLSQSISYIEVPLELEYALVNNKLGVNVIGGASAFILSDNEVVSEIDNQKQKIGEANNINDVSYSANIGLGIDYKFSDKLKFNLEPTFKYQMNAYSETSGDFKPYIIGVYTGFSYKF